MQELRNHPWKVGESSPRSRRGLVTGVSPSNSIHESFDGSGYPFGLSGDDLSFGGRIVAVADSFEVMTAVRSYKKAMSPVAGASRADALRREPVRPAIVRAFLNVSIGRLRWTIGPLSWMPTSPLSADLALPHAH